MTYILIYFYFIFIVDTITDVPILLPPRPVAFLHTVLIHPSLWPAPHCCPCPWVMWICSLANPFTFSHQFPLPLSPLTDDSLFCVHVCFYFVSLFLVYGPLYILQKANSYRIPTLEVSQNFTVKTLLLGTKLCPSCLCKEVISVA